MNEDERQALIDQHLRQLRREMWRKITPYLIWITLIAAAWIVWWLCR